MRSSGRTTALLFVFFQGLYALTSSGNAFRVPDEFEVYFQAEHLIDAGDLSVPQTLAIRSGNGDSVFFGKVGLDHKPYAPYGPLSAVLALPHHLIGRLVAAVAGVHRAPLPAGIVWVFLVGGITMTATATAAALSVAGFHRAALALDTPNRMALLLALLLGGATVLWPYGTSFYSEAYQAAAFVWAAALLIGARKTSTGTPRARLLVITASVLLAIAGLTKVTSLVFTPGFVIAVLCERSQPWRSRVSVALTLAAGIACAVAIHVGWNIFRFNQPFDFGYNWALETIPQLPPRQFLAADIPRGLVVLLLSPGKSIIVWAPALLLALAGSKRFFRGEPAAGIGIASTTALGLIFFAAYLFPEGGYAHGPRNLVPILPLMLLPAGGRDSRWPASWLFACATVGITVAWLAVSVSFLEDQGLGDLGAGARTVYYERITPPPGRVWNRYRLDYLPFVSAMRTPGWLHADRLGEGPDFFPLHLLQARRQLPEGRSVPVWLVWAMPAFWLAIVVASGAALARAPTS